MEVCGAVSIYCENGATWTYTCQGAPDHEPGQHDYHLDVGQPPLPGAV
jgi:hypothetical protein